MARDHSIASLPDFWGDAPPPKELTAFLAWLDDTPPQAEATPDEDPASLYREAYYAGMADGPVPGTD